MCNIVITEDRLKEAGFKWVEETSYPCSKYWSRGKIAIDLVGKRFFLKRFKLTDDYAALNLPEYFQGLQNLIFVLTNELITPL